jgi:hypothetical protein
VPHDVDDDVLRVAGGQLDPGDVDRGHGRSARGDDNDAGADEHDACDDVEAITEPHADL